MQYSAQFWTNPENLTTAIQRLIDESNDLAFDVSHALNYDLNICWNEAEREKLEALEQRYYEAIEVCHLFLNLEISLECLLYELLRLEFQSFIQSLKDFLPDDLKSRFIVEENLPPLPAFPSPTSSSTSSNE